MQPMILSLIDEEIALARDADVPVCVLEMPLLYEERLDRLCDLVWCVTLPEEMQIARLTERDGFTREQALQRIRSQMPAAEKAARADVCISTAGSMEETAQVVRTLWKTLIPEESGEEDTL